MVTLKELELIIASDYYNDDGFTLTFKGYLMSVAMVWETEIYESEDMTEDDFCFYFGSEAFNSVMMYRLEKEGIGSNLPDGILRYPDSYYRKSKRYQG